MIVHRPWKTFQNLWKLERAAFGRPFLCADRLTDQATAEAHCHGVGSAARLKLREQVPYMAFHRLLREEEANADLAVHEAVGDELQYLDLARRGLLLQLLHRGLERQHLTGRVAASGDRFEAGRVLAVSGQDGIALRGVHGPGIDRPETHL